MEELFKFFKTVHAYKSACEDLLLSIQRDAAAGIDPPMHLHRKRQVVERSLQMINAIVGREVPIGNWAMAYVRMHSRANKMILGNDFAALLEALGQPTYRGPSGAWDIRDPRILVDQLTRTLDALGNYKGTRQFFKGDQS